MVDSEEALQHFRKLLATPERTAVALLFQNSEDVRKHLLSACSLLYKRIETLTKTHGKLIQKKGIHGLSDLRELYLGEPDAPLDAETLWAQVELQNTALLKVVRISLGKLSKSSEKGLVKLLDDEEEDNGDDDESVSHDDENDEVKEQEKAEDDADDKESDSDNDEVARRMKRRMEQAFDDMDDDKDSVQDEVSLEDPAKNELNDGFFDIQEMEAFADEEEEYLPDEAFGIVQEDKPVDKRSFHQKQRDGDFGNNTDDEQDATPAFTEASARRRKYRKDDEVSALMKLYQTPEDESVNDDDDNAINFTAVDLYGKPKQKYLEAWKKKASERQKGGPIAQEDDDSWNEFDFSKRNLDNDHDSGWNDRNDGDDDSSTPVTRGTDVQMGLGNHDAEPVERTVAGTNSRDRQHSNKLQLQTMELEREMLAEKPWQMTGEATASSRPVDSLLEATPEFERASKQAPIMTVEETLNLEELIKKRILDEDWDDVVPRELPDVGWHKKRGELPEVSQEKSKLGLGELYEREYLKKAVGYDVDAADKKTEEDKAKDEMKAMFANLCSKLDALSNYHFAPRPIADEAEIHTITKPAIAMEEVIPLYVSNTRSSAPEEIYASKRGRDGVLRHDSELEQHDRKRIRSTKKAARRKRRKEKEADEKIVSRLQPGLGLNNPYEKRKMREELSTARSRGIITTGKEDTNEYGGSNTFFKRMQEEAQHGIQTSTRKTGKEKDEPQATSNSYKL